MRSDDQCQKLVAQIGRAVVVTNELAVGELLLAIFDDIGVVGVRKHDADSAVLATERLLDVPPADDG